eukprot:10264964-Alexandrium_andersonii.AAC.1
MRNYVSIEDAASLRSGDSSNVTQICLERLTLRWQARPPEPPEGAFSAVPRADSESDDEGD